MTSRSISPVQLAVVLFGLCFAFGFWLAKHKPVWNDEIFTQLSTVEKPSYVEILKLDFEEGNACPLFYLLQKAITDTAGYRFPQQWQGEWSIKDLRSQMVLRIGPNLFSALTIALIFYFFARSYSLAAGGYALLITLSSFMIWAYWVEARPYSIWTFLTTAQCLLFLVLLKGKGENRRAWQWLLLTHVLLSFTVVISIVQVFLVSLALWLFKERRWQRYVGLTLLPAAVSVFYYFHSPQYHFVFSNTISQLIGASLPKDRMLILVLYPLFLGWYYWRDKGKVSVSDGFWREGTSFLFLSALMVLSAIAVLLKLKMSVVEGRPGFQVSNRYLIYLTPVGIIGVTLFSIHILRAFQKNKWAKLILILVFAGLLLLRAMRTYGQLQGIYS